jgi:hypothetical protein
VAVLTDGDDSVDWSGVSLPVTFYGGNGNDTAVGGSGIDSFDGGAGIDTIAARDGRAETVGCGDGADRGTVDAEDLLAADCESAVERPASAQPPAAQPPAANPGPAGGGDQQTSAGTAPTGTRPAPIGAGGGAADAHSTGGDAPVTIETPSTVVLSASGAIAVGVTCTAAAGDCSGSIEILGVGGSLKARTQVVSARRSKRAATRKAVVLGRADFSVHAGQTEQVTVRVSRGGRQRIIKKKKRRTRAKIVVTVRAPDGTESTSVKTITIAAARERRTAGRPKPPKPTKGGRGR